MFVASYGKTIITFVRNCCSSFQNGCIILWWIRVPIALHPYKKLVLFFVFVVGGGGGFCWPLVISMEWYLIVVLTHNFLMTNDVLHLFIGLFDIYTSFLVKYLFTSYLRFLKWIVCFYCWVLSVFVYFGCKSFIRYVFCKYFLATLLFVFLGIFHRAELLILIKFNLTCFLLWVVLLVLYLKSHN